MNLLMKHFGNEKTVKFETLLNYTGSNEDVDTNRQLTAPRLVCPQTGGVKQ